MITPTQCLEKFGDPKNPKFEPKWMGLYTMPESIHSILGPMPRKIYCHRYFWSPFVNALIEICDAGNAPLIEEYGGIFCIRKMRGGLEYSIHSWGLAVDLNVSTNQLGVAPQMDMRIVQAFVNNGLEWGGNWHRPDGMHFQLATI